MHHRYLHRIIFAMQVYSIDVTAYRVFFILNNKLSLIFLSYRLFIRKLTGGVEGNKKCRVLSYFSFKESVFQECII